LTANSKEPPEGLDTPVAPLVEVELLDLDVADARAAILWLNRPDDLNPLSWEMVLSIGAALEALEVDGTVRTVFVSGRGRAFSAGGDLKAYVRLQESATDFAQFVDDLSAVLSRIRSMSKPVVALVNGFCVAGGLELLLSCDFAYMEESAMIGDSHLNFGQIGGGGVLALLPRIIGPARARELTLSGRRLTSTECWDWGLVNKVVTDGGLIAAGLEFARQVAAKSSLGSANAKHVMNAGWADGVGLDEALRLERERSVLYCVTSPDAREGLAAFGEKRTPVYPPRTAPGRPEASWTRVKRDTVSN
jgi:enoyl-CoA hydratase/carnithine racemase